MECKGTDKVKVNDCVLQENNERVNDLREEVKGSVPQAMLDLFADFSPWLKINESTQ